MICDREKRGPISELQKLILRAIIVQTDRTGIQPTQAEIGMRVALSASSVAKNLEVLDGLGWIEKSGNRAVLIPDDVRAELRDGRVAEVVAPEPTVVAEEVAPEPKIVADVVCNEGEAAHG